MSDDNRGFYLNTLRSIVKTDDGYYLQKVYDEDENGKMIQTEEDKNNPNKNYFSKNCYNLDIQILFLLQGLFQCCHNTYISYEIEIYASLP